MEGLRVAGLEPVPLDFSAERSLAIKLLLLMGITNDQRPIEIEMVRKPGFAPGPSPSQGEMLLVTPQSCWSPWSDSHRRIRVYETRPVAAEAQGQRSRMKEE